MKHSLISLIFFILTVLAVAFFWENSLLTCGILAFLSITFLLILKDKYNVYFYLTVATSGALAESFCVMMGAWKYSYANFLGIPYWLPLAWGMAGLGFKDIYGLIKLLRNRF